MNIGVAELALIGIAFAPAVLFVWFGAYLVLNFLRGYFDDAPQA
ncbi:hypothetical protein ACG98H_07465 [Corynebacterium sp. L4756]